MSSAAGTPSVPHASPESAGPPGLQDPPRPQGPPAPTLRGTVLAAVTTTVALLGLVALGQASGRLLLVAPLAATAMIVCGSPALPPAQPRAVLLGQFASAVAGLACGGLFGRSLWVAAVAAGLSSGLMSLLRAVHAPAAATAALVVVQHPAPLGFLLLLSVGSGLLVLTGAAAARIGAIGSYPARWW